MIERPHFTYIFATPNQTINREAAANEEREREIRNWHHIIRPIWSPWDWYTTPHPIVKHIILRSWHPISSTLNEGPPVRPIWHPISLIRPPVLDNMTLPPKRTESHRVISPPFPHPTPNFNHTPKAVLGYIPPGHSEGGETKRPIPVTNYKPFTPRVGLGLPKSRSTSPKLRLGGTRPYVPPGRAFPYMPDASEITPPNAGSSTNTTIRLLSTKLLPPPNVGSGSSSTNTETTVSPSPTNSFFAGTRPYVPPGRAFPYIPEEFGLTSSNAGSTETTGAPSSTNSFFGGTRPYTPPGRAFPYIPEEFGLTSPNAGGNTNTQTATSNGTPISLPGAIAQRTMSFMEHMGGPVNISPQNTQTPSNTQSNGIEPTTLAEITAQRIINHMEAMGSPVNISPQTTPEPSPTQSNSAPISLPDVIAQRTINNMEVMGSPVSETTQPQIPQAAPPPKITPSGNPLPTGIPPSKSNNGGIFGFFSGLASDIVNGLGDVSKAVQNAKSPLVAQGAVQPQENSGGGGIFGFFSGLGSDVANAMANVGKTVQNAVGSAGKDIASGLGDVNNAIQSAYTSAYGNQASQEKQQLQQQYQQQLQKIQQEEQQVKNEYQNEMTQIEQQMQQVQNEYKQQSQQIQQYQQQLQQEYQQALQQIQQEAQQVQEEYQQNPNSPEMQQWYNTQMQKLNNDLQSLNEWYNSQTQQLNSADQSLQQWYNTNMQQLSNSAQSLQQWYKSSTQQLNNDTKSLQQWYNTNTQKLNSQGGGGNPFQTALNDIADVSALVGYYGTEAFGGAGEELAHLASGKGLENFGQAIAQFNRAGGQNVARTVGNVTEVALPAIVTAIAAPELLPAVIIGEASSVGLGEAISKFTTGQFQPLNQVLLEANEGGVLGAVGELGGLALESGLAKGAGALTKLITGSEEAASKVSELTPVWRGIGGALTNAGIQAIFTQNPEQIGIAAAIGGLAGGLGPGIAGKIMSKIDEMRGTGVIAEPEVYQSPLTDETIQGWKAVLPSGDVVHLVPDTSFGEGNVREFVDRYAGEVGENNLVAHSTTSPSFYAKLARGETVPVKPIDSTDPDSAWGWRSKTKLNFLDMYWSPGEGPDEAVALTAYGGLADTRPSIPDIRLGQSSLRDVIYRMFHPFEKGAIILSNADIEPGPQPPYDLVNFVKSNLARTGSMNATADRILSNPEIAQMLQDWRTDVETFSAKNGVLVPGSEDLMRLSHERQVVLAPGAKLEPTGDVYNIWVRKTPELFENLPGPLRDILSDWAKMKSIYVDIEPGEPTNLPDYNIQNARQERSVDVEGEEAGRERYIEEGGGRDIVDRELQEPLIRQLTYSMLRGYEDIPDQITRYLARDIYSPPRSIQDIESPPRDINPPRSPPPSSRIDQPTRDEITSPPRGSYSPPPNIQQIQDIQQIRDYVTQEIQEPYDITEENNIREENVVEQSPPPPVFQYQNPAQEGSIPIGPPPILPAGMPGGFGGGGGEVQEISGMAGEVLNL